MPKRLLQKQHRGLLLAALASLGALLVLAFAVYWRVSDQNRIEDLAHSNRQRISDIAALAISTNKALCAFTADLQQRYTGGVSYLREHPGPEPFPGITRATVQQSLANQKRTLDSLVGLHCPPNS